MHSAEKPYWLKKSVWGDPQIAVTGRILKELGVNTVCRSANCPNIFDCFSRRHATFLILGRVCSRTCRFCSVDKGEPSPADSEEAGKIAEAAFLLGLGHVIITSVTRDDLPDGGAGRFADTIRAARSRFKDRITVEVLVPDFQGDPLNIETVLSAGPDIFGHNVETVPGLYKEIRPSADYEKSLAVLKTAKMIRPQVKTKSAFMLGLGEKEDQVISVMKDLKASGCDMLAIGQYLRPSPEQIEVKRYVRPEEFLMLKEIAYSLGFSDVQSGPFVRSSYREREGV